MRFTCWQGALLRKSIQNLPKFGEFAVVIVLCFGYSITMSIYSLFLPGNVIVFDNWAMIRRIFLTGARLLVVAFVLSWRGWNLRRFGFKFSWSAVLAGVPVFVSYTLLYAASYLLTFKFYPLALDLRGDAVYNGFEPLILVSLLINSVFEEAIVCGYVVPVLAPYGAALSIIASALIRLGYHLYYGPMALVGILPMGLLYAFVYWRWRNLWPLITAHTIHNVWATIIVPYLRN